MLAEDRNFQRPGHGDRRHGPQPSADDRLRVATRRPVDEPPSAALVLTPLVGLLLWAGLIAIVVT